MRAANHHHWPGTNSSGAVRAASPRTRLLTPLTSSTRGSEERRKTAAQAVSNQRRSARVLRAGAATHRRRAEHTHGAKLTQLSTQHAARRSARRQADLRLGAHICRAGVSGNCSHQHGSVRASFATFGSHGGSPTATGRDGAGAAQLPHHDHLLPISGLRNPTNLPGLLGP